MAKANSHFVILGILLASLLVSQVSCTSICTNIGLEISETTIDSILVGIWWLGNNNTVVYVQSNNYLVYRSSDEGRTWTQQNYKFNSKLISHVIPTANPVKVYFLGIYGEWGVWRSYDAGETVTYDAAYSGYSRGIIFNMIFPHPYKEDFAIAWGYNEACNTGGPGPCGTTLYYTSNFGVDWHTVDTFTEEFEWAATELIQPDTSTNVVTILYTAWQNKSVDSPYRDPYESNLQLLRTDITHYTNSVNDHVERSVVAQWTLGMFKSPENETVIFYYAPALEGGQELFVSEDDGETWNQAMFPTELEQQGWSIIDDAEGAVFINIQADAGVTYGNVYSSQTFGEEYTMILKHNKRSSVGGVWGAADFIRVESLEGVYLANQYVTDNINSHKPPSENDPVQSLITFDMGGSWHRITPPTVDSNGHPVSCTNCFLQLNGPEESTYGRFYSIPSAVGVIVGTGNIGTHLNDTTANTYLSRDGGVSWQEIQKGTWTYEIGDHGGILLLAPQSSEVYGIIPGVANNTILFSKDEGNTFQTCQFTDQPMQIWNVLIEPSSTSEVFILYGTRGQSGVLSFIDFRKTFTRACQHPEQAGSAQSDYELWSPSDPYSSGDCMLGRKTFYTRKKRDVNCYNPQQYETIVNSTNCPCTRDDYECDYCFEPNEQNVCVQVCKPEVECNSEGYYMKTQGYRAIPGDTCDPSTGLDLMPVKTKCSDQDSGGGSDSGNAAGVVVAIVFIVLAAGGAIGFMLYVYKYQQPEWIYERIFANRAHGNNYSSLAVETMDEEPSTMFDESILTNTQVDDM